MRGGGGRAVIYGDPSLIWWEDKRSWEQWGNCHGVADNEPWDFLLLFGEGVADVTAREKKANPYGWNSVEAQQKEFAAKYCLAGCRVIDQCLRWAEARDKFDAGCWGGLTEAERRERRRSKVKGRSS
jgi:hypothetical protein